MEYTKYIVLLCLFDELTRQKELDPKMITTKYNINNRQMWNYIKNIKEYFDSFTTNKLTYDITTKKYYLK